jgi:Multicopper oxidase
MHFHLVNVQVLSRQPFNVPAYDGVPQFTDKPRFPDANELGWKETVRMNPSECTTIIAKFDLPKLPYAVPESPRTGGNEYVWHCHILEHEEHDEAADREVREPRRSKNNPQVKRPPGNWVASSLQGRIVLTEGKVRQNFLAKSYEPKKQGVKGFFDNKRLCFQ